MNSFQKHRMFLMCSEGSFPQPPSHIANTAMNTDTDIIVYALKNVNRQSA